MRRTTRLACLALTTILFSGCQQVAWKPGASSADLDRDTAACEADHAEAAAVQECLRKRGWVLRVPKASADPAEDAEVATGAGTMPAVSTAPILPATGAAPAAGNPRAEPGSGTASAPRDKSVPVTKPADPLRRSQVQAWWKMGGQGDALTADIDACVAQLGPDHKPDLEKRLYTRGLIDCLKGKGWFGK